MTVLERLRSLDIVLPTPPGPLASYVPAVRAGSLVYVAGQGPMVDGVPVIRGKLGDGTSEEAAAGAARLAVINAIAVLAGALGDLEKLVRIVKLNGYVNCTPDFERQHVVVNGASDLLAEVFGERGRHARTAIGTNSLPLGIPVEIELIAEAAI